jgi:hypothetical protein
MRVAPLKCKMGHQCEDWHNCCFNTKANHSATIHNDQETCPRFEQQPLGSALRTQWSTQEGGGVLLKQIRQE